MKIYNYSGDYAYQDRKKREEALGKENVAKPQVTEQKTENDVENKVSGGGEANVAQQKETKKAILPQETKVKKGKTPKDNKEG